MINVSYVVTIYNKEACIKEMVEGLKNQIGDFESEYIFVDDGSTDNSLLELSEAVRDMSNVHIVSQVNAGPSKAVNTGIKLAKCDYVYLVDGDDKLLPDATISLLKTRQTTGCKVIKGVHVNNYPDNKRYDGRIKIIEDSLARALKFFPIGGCSSSLIETNLLNQVGGADERVFIQDYSLALRLALVTNFATINKIVAHDINAGQQRLSSNKLKENRDTALARYYFIKDHPTLDHRLKLRGLSAHLSKSWSWYRKHNRQPYFSKYFWRYIITRGSLFNLSYDDVLRWTKEACEVYKEED
jgi:glycosyltransferase involved in cell wall biosynthesis